ncbi:MAG TPA: hypothetical protein VLB00_14315 [Gemmatimonadales bacterium]|nr:hypothetical protein [Gemmatimonadales bacterium]
MAESTGFTRRNWQVQRIGWLLMVLLVLLGLAGLFGQGRLARREAAVQGLTLRYQRVVRLEAIQVLEFALGARPSGEVALELDSGFVSRTDIERIIPEPREIAVSPEGQRLSFSSAGSGSVAVRLLFVPKKLGRLRARFATPGGAELPVSFLVLP